MFDFIDREIQKEPQVNNSRRKKTRGFQGCKNKEACGFTGFYLCTYSREGLCDECECEQFPERFHGCMFCRNKQKHNSVCSTCKSGFEGYIKENVNFSHKRVYGQPTFRLSRRKSNHPFISANEFKELRFVELNRFTKEWPGFYAGINEEGDHQWVRPSLRENGENVTLTVTWENCHEVLDEFLKEKGIYLENEIQIQ